MIDRILATPLVDREVEAPKSARIIGEASPDLQRVLSFLRTTRAAMSKLEEELIPLCAMNSLGGGLNEEDVARHRELHNEQERLGADLNVGVELGKFLTRAESGGTDPMKVQMAKGFVMYEPLGVEAGDDADERDADDEVGDPIAAILGKALGGRVTVIPVGGRS
jgi:hypothetical protein